jgi:hypothetical protein
MKKRITIMSIMAVTALVAVFVSGCGGDKPIHLGITIPGEAPVVKLGQVMESPADYDGKTFVMKGTIVGQCASLCEFFFRDGAHRATIFPQGYDFPRLPSGKPVTVYVQATSGTEQVVFSALGVEIK